MFKNRVAKLFIFFEKGSSVYISVCDFMVDQIAGNCLFKVTELPVNGDCRSMRKNG